MPLFVNSYYNKPFTLTSIVCCVVIGKFTSVSSWSFNVDISAGKCTYSETCLRRPLPWETTCLEGPLVLAEDPTFQCKWTCHQRPPALRDSFMANGAVSQDRFYCIIMYSAALYSDLLYISNKLKNTLIHMIWFNDKCYYFHYQYKPHGNINSLSQNN